MPRANQWRAVACAAEHRIVLEAVISRLDGDEPWRQRPAHRIGRALVRAPSAVGAGIEIEHVLPGEVFEGLHAEGFHLVQMLVVDALSHRLHRSAVQLCEVNVEERCFHVELNSERPVAQQEVKGQHIDKIGAEDSDSEAVGNGVVARTLFNIHGSDRTARNSAGWPCCV